MERIEITRSVFSSKNTITFMMGGDKKVNTMGPAGIHSSACPPSKTARPAKYNTLASFLQELLAEKDIFIAFSHNTAFCKFGTHAATCDGLTIKWVDTAGHGAHSLYPFFAYCLMSGTGLNNTELLTCFQNIKNDAKYGPVDPANVLKACDSFYYGIAVSHTEINSEESGVTKEEIEQAFMTGLYQVPGFLSDIGMPVPVYASISAPANPEKDSTIVRCDMEHAQDGKYILGHEWSEEQQKKIPSLSTLDTFIPSKAFYSLLNKSNIRLNKCLLRMDTGKTEVEAIEKDYINCFVTGKAGTGKTTAAYALGAALGMPVYTINCSRNTEEDQFEGKTKVIEGKLSFIETDFLKAYQNGGIIVLEEVNLVDPAVIMGALGQAVEFPFILMKDGYMPVRRHPLCIILGTFNVGTNGSRRINEAFSSRFKQTYLLDDPNKNDFIKILMTQGHQRKAANWVYSVYSKILTYLNSPDVNKSDYALNVTLRGCLGALEEMEEGESAKDAIFNSLIGKIAEFDLETALEVKKNVVDIQPDM